MNCPLDGTQLAITERQGVEIDYCPQCRGVWLDRGELDKIIEKSEGAQPLRPPVAPAPQHHMEPRPREQHDNYERHSYDQHHSKKKKRENFLGDLFDF